MTPIATLSQPYAIEIGTGPLPGAKNPESWHTQYGSRFARNVTIATLTPFLPEPAKASGAAVIVAPGGGFRTLSMENEGTGSVRNRRCRRLTANEGFAISHAVHFAAKPSRNGKRNGSVHSSSLKLNTLQQFDSSRLRRRQWLSSGPSCTSVLY